MDRPSPVEAWQSAALSGIEAQVDALRSQWRRARPFGFCIADDFLPAKTADAILDAYPKPGIDGWDQKTYIHQRKKFTRNAGFTGVIAEFFELTAAPRFRELMTAITGIDTLLPDESLLGGGLHQILRGGFLDVHVDFNYHPKTKRHRRLNLLLYMNRDWKPEYEGYLELWDMKAKVQVANIAPLFNRAVLFETNEVSYHGHPRPLDTPQSITRKSLTVYYYTAQRAEPHVEHNTLYEQTTGLGGYLKTIRSTVEALAERLRAAGPRSIGADLANRVRRLIKGLPPENR